MKKYVGVFCPDTHKFIASQCDGNLELEQIYQLLSYTDNSVDLFDRVIINDEIDFLVDDIGLLRHNPIICEYDVNGMTIRLAGRVIVVKKDLEGNYLGMTKDEIMNKIGDVTWRIYL